MYWTPVHLCGLTLLQQVSKLWKWVRKCYQVAQIEIFFRVHFRKILTTMQSGRRSKSLNPSFQQLTAATGPAVANPKGVDVFVLCAAFLFYFVSAERTGTALLHRGGDGLTSWITSDVSLLSICEKSQWSVNEQNPIPTLEFSAYLKQTRIIEPSGFLGVYLDFVFWRLLVVHGKQSKAEDACDFLHYNTWINWGKKNWFSSLCNKHSSKRLE